MWLKKFNHLQTVIVVDDKSTDETIKEVKNRCNIISTQVNLGYDSALERGILEAIKIKSEIIITFDADGQHPAELIETIFNLIEKEGLEIVVGCRDKLPRISEEIFSFYSSLKYGIRDLTCGMKGYSTKFLNTVVFPRLINHSYIYSSQGLKRKAKSIKFKKRIVTLHSVWILKGEIKVMKTFIKSFFFFYLKNFNFLFTNLLNPPM